MLDSALKLLIAQLQMIPVVQAIYLYGSRARGTHHPRADIDLAIVCPGAGVREWQQLLDIIEEADTLLVIDCLRLDAEPVDSPLRHAIEQEKWVLYERQ